MKYQACYWQHFRAEINEFELLADAINFLEYNSDYGELYEIGIFLDGKLYWRSKYCLSTDAELQKDYDKNFAPKLIKK